MLDHCHSHKIPIFDVLVFRPLAHRAYRPPVYEVIRRHSTWSWLERSTQGQMGGALAHFQGLVERRALDQFGPVMRGCM